MVFDYLFDFLFLPVIFFIGFVTSYQDFRYGKIKNKWIVLGLLWGLGIYILSLIWTLTAPFLAQIFSIQFGFILPSYLLKVFINSAAALIVGFLLWYFDFWSAGDAKLFFIFSLLLPLKYYWKTALPYFPSFALLINVFVSALLFLMGQNIFYFLRTISVQKIVNFYNLALLKVKTNYLAYLKTFLGFLLIFLIFQIARLQLGTLGQSVLWQAGIILLIALLRKFLNNIFQKRWFLILAYSAIIIYFIAGSYPVFVKFTFLMTDSLFFMIIFTIFTFLVSMVEQGQKKHLPFAIWVLIGALITIFTKGSVVSLFLKNLF